MRAKVESRAVSELRYFKLSSNETTNFRTIYTYDKCFYISRQLFVQLNFHTQTKTSFDF